VAVPQTASEGKLVSVAVGRDHVEGPNPALALVLAIAVGAAVFALMWAVRKTFGMKH
jgi:hypothetical protein